MKRSTKKKLYGIYNIFRMTGARIFSAGRFSASIVQKISPRAMFNTETRDSSISLGKRAYIMDGTYINADGGRIVIGSGIFINRNCNIVSKQSIRIGDGVSIGPNVMIYDHDHGLREKSGTFVCDEVVIGNNVWIGGNAVILRGSVIGDNAVIGAGAVIKGSIPAGSVVYNKLESVVKAL